MNPSINHHIYKKMEKKCQKEEVRFLRVVCTHCQTNLDAGTAKKRVGGRWILYYRIKITLEIWYRKATID